MNTHLKYNNELMGYLSDYQLDDYGKIEMLKFLLYDRSWYDRIFFDGFIRNLERSTCLTLDNNPDTEDIDNNKLFQYDIIKEGEDNFLLIRAI